ncbi:MAG TPA: nucleotidyltransferase family protein [Candidatus Avilachnospira avistercoris]|nr:nucleotidyltransferase family protein [Candidatus Avilachnospira avistercoris]
MKTAAIICELNPAHNGHKYIFDEVKRRSGADYVIALMSGSYVQRGEPALIDKYLRTKMALKLGADLVLELPSPFSFQSAREFAMAGVRLAEATDIIDVLGFGAEFPLSAPEAQDMSETYCGESSSACDKENALPMAPKDGYDSLHDDSSNEKCLTAYFSEKLKTAAEILLTEPEEFKTALRAALKEGLSYPKASELALKACGIEEASLISSPNNILAREYLRALLITKKKKNNFKIPSISTFGSNVDNSLKNISDDLEAYEAKYFGNLSTTDEALNKRGHKSINALIIPRIGDGYNEERPKDGRFASATALRKLLLSGASFSEIAPYIPTELYDEYKKLCDANIPLITPDDMSFLLNYRLQVLKNFSMPQTRMENSDGIFDIPRELYARIMDTAGLIMSYSERIELLKAKSYTYTRLSRALLNLALSVSESEVKAKKDAGYAEYIRILGFKKDSAELLSELKKNAKLPIVSNAAANRELLGSSVFYDNIYYSLATKKSCPNEYERQIVII